MTYGHRERLIREKLFVPLSDDEIAKREAADPKLLSKYERYDWVVYRADEWLRHVDEEYSINRCKEAELIQSCLKEHEANGLAEKLKSSDKKQPPYKNSKLLPMYKVCTRAKWDAWVVV